MKKMYIIGSLLLLNSILLNAQKRYELKSPSGKLEVNVEIGKEITYSVSHEGDLLIHPSSISMKLDKGKSFGTNPKLIDSKQNSVRQEIKTPIYKRSSIIDQYNEIVLKFKGDYQLIFRAYDDGIAYRFIATGNQDFLVENETVNFNFGTDCKAFVPYVRGEGSFEKQFFNSFENTYSHIPLSQWEKDRLAFLPLVVECAKGKKICITEADLENYPGMYLNNPDDSTSLKAVFAPYPKRTEQGGHNRLQMLIKERQPYIAQCKGAQKFPWRIAVIASNDKELVDNDMVYKLASPSRIQDASWIKPGKVAWDWWNDWNIYGVDFQSGINNETYKYYIDFASEHHVEYVILDEGWAVNMEADLMQVVPEINLKELADYAGKKNVGLILWAGYQAFNRDMENVCRHYSQMGIKGFKVDFMDRDDQEMVHFYYQTAETAAKYHLLIDFHGAYKPTGLQRTFPNAINFEGVNGLEQLKWADIQLDQVTYDVTIPFIRMLAGPMDYTQGAMRNANKQNYRPVNAEPMSQGTRCRQLAEYIIFESPLNMLCDSPANYMKEKETTNFIASIPTVWDQTIALNGEIAKYVSIARQKGSSWYIGSLTNWDKRKLELDLSFLGTGNFKAEIFRDGINADRVAQDYVHETISVPSNRKLSVEMAPGGGFIAKITKGN